ncbi:MAG: hypothetical protein V4792_09410 [Pseudomonadota bacterium]
MTPSLSNHLVGSSRAELIQSLQRGVLAGLAVLTLVLAPAARAPHNSPPSTAIERPARWADFGRHQPSADARHIADWIADSGDNAGAAFIILDKRQATLYVFDEQARLRNSTPVLLGAARGDDNVPGIGARPIAEVQPHERTTPAGRFVAQRGRNTLGEDVVWVDYEAAVSMHRVRATEPSERRLERLASKTIDDNRVSYGCINVPAAFYESFVLPTTQSARRPLVYVLPEERSVKEVFGSYDVAALSRWQ